MNYYNKYLKYKSKYNDLKNIIGGDKSKSSISNEEKKISKHYKNIIDYHGYDYVLDQTQKESNKFKTAYESWILINRINSFIDEITKNKKNITLIGIGDSPSIFLQIFIKIFKSEKIELKYLPISGMRNLTNDEKKIGIEKLSKLEDYISTDNILWVDYVSTGNSFFNFLDILPKKIKKKSYFFIYGDDGLYHNRSKEIKNKKKYLFHNINIQYFFSYFVAATVGNSEKYYMRCINKKKLNKDFKLELFTNEDIPSQKDIYGEHCISFTNFLFELIKMYFESYFPIKIKK